MFVFAALLSATAFGGNTFIANNASGFPGETGVLVQVDLNNDDESGGFQFDMAFDPNTLEYVDAYVGSRNSSWASFLFYSEPSTGLVRIINFAFSAGGGRLLQGRERSSHWNSMCSRPLLPGIPSWNSRGPCCPTRTESDLRWTFYPASSQ